MECMEELQGSERQGERGKEHGRGDSSNQDRVAGTAAECVSLSIWLVIISCFMTTNGGCGSGTHTSLREVIGKVFVRSGKSERCG